MRVRLCRVAAKRFARQLHANAKYPALDGGLQEAAHGSVALFDGLFATTTPEPMCFTIRSTTSRPATMPLRVVLMRDAPDNETEKDAGLRRAAEYLAGERGVRTSTVTADAGCRSSGSRSSSRWATSRVCIWPSGLGIDPSPTRSVLEMKERIESAAAHERATEG